MAHAAIAAPGGTASEGQASVGAPGQHYPRGEQESFSCGLDGIERHERLRGPHEGQSLLSVAGSESSRERSPAAARTCSVQAVEPALYSQRAHVPTVPRRGSAGNSLDEGCREGLVRQFLKAARSCEAAPDPAGDLLSVVLRPQCPHIDGIWPHVSGSAAAEAR